MAVVEFSGTQTAVIGTEHNLATPSATYTVRMLCVDLAALAATEPVELRFYGPVLSGGANSLIRGPVTFTGTLSDPHVQSIQIVMPQGGTISLKQTSGTGRAIPWAVLTLGVIAVESSGSQTAVIGTEHNLATPSTSKTRALLVDAANLVASETLELRVYGPVLTAGTNSLIRIVSYTGALAEPHIQGVPIVMPQSGTLSLKQTTGTGRAFPWAVVTFD